MKPLTKRQAKVLEFIVEFCEDHGFSPTFREIGKRFRIRSPNGVMCHLEALRAKGAVTWRRNQARTLRAVSAPPQKPQD